ncbi:ATP-binding cassette domain-containing protein [Floccifex sp.]|uniref:ATP-binding cassette domain-containing protein n=1 Tax=Floccifex sp. TaxID=2815810 RepID=UPI002A762698|nr:ATP-binding cassette domain-containing protein [Floccifex sp.]MDD7280549.1 ATP-binding cassette domain-containing protein [Erysipelotrichaceae bacterium]MDY2959125.1 ATP-binding cassette domain-containing protein [Floccifex sp.]
MIKLINVSKKYGDKIIFDHLNYEFIDHKRYVVEGNSGIGKTTLLKVIAGLESIDDGCIEKNQCRLSYVFQQDYLFDHLSAYDNILIGINEKISDEELEKRMNELCEDVCCTDFLHQRAKTLSGGQRQRIALVRALIQLPDVILMDEPLSHLDTNLKKKMMDVIIFLQEKYQFTLIYVTHDPQEAEKIGQEFLYL